MTNHEHEGYYAQMGIPGLLRNARKAYGNVVRAAFAEEGFDDIPRNGADVLARVYGDSSPLAGITRQLGVSKQAVSQLIDTMVMRGYLERAADPDDRRRMLLTLTPRGEAAATASWRAATAADEVLQRRLTAEGVAALRAGLVALCEMADESADGPAGAAEQHGHDD